MSFFDAALLGIIQGLTEFFPVSSSGHLILIREFFGLQEGNGLAFDAIIHLGTLVAVIWVLRKDIKSIIFGLFHKQGYEDFHHLAWILLLATIPAGLIGFFFADTIETRLRAPSVVAWSLLIWGIALYLVDRHSDHQKKSVISIGWLSSSLIGLSQAIALIPGTSRSGITITAGRFLKLDRSTATRFSFLLSVPIITAAGLFKFIEILKTRESLEYYFLIGFFMAIISGIFAISFLLKLVQTRGYLSFAIYRIILALVLFWIFK